MLPQNLAPNFENYADSSISQICNKPLQHLIWSFFILIDGLIDNHVNWLVDWLIDGVHLLSISMPFWLSDWGKIMSSHVQEKEVHIFKRKGQSFKPSLKGPMDVFDAFGRKRCQKVVQIMKGWKDCPERITKSSLLLCWNPHKTWVTSLRETKITIIHKISCFMYSL